MANMDMNVAALSHPPPTQLLWGGTQSVFIHKYILSVSAGGLRGYLTILGMMGTVTLLILDSCGQRYRSPPKAVFHGSGWRGVIAVISL